MPTATTTPHSLPTPDLLRAELLDIAEKVAFIHFPECVQFDHVYPTQNRWGEPIPVVDTEMHSRRPEERAAARDEFKQEFGIAQRGNHIKDVDRYSKPIRVVKDLIARHAEQIVLAQIDLAIGTKVLRKDKDGQEIGVYDSTPDAKVGSGLLDRIMGKPVEYKEVEQNTSVDQRVRIYIPDNGRNVANKPIEHVLRELPDGSVVDSTYIEPTSYTNDPTDEQESNPTDEFSDYTSGPAPSPEKCATSAPVEDAE